MSTAVWKLDISSDDFLELLVDLVLDLLENSAGEPADPVSEHETIEDRILVVESHIGLVHAESFDGQGASAGSRRQRVELRSHLGPEHTPWNNGPEDVVSDDQSTQSARVPVEVERNIVVKPPSNIVNKFK